MKTALVIAASAIFAMALHAQQRDLRKTPGTNILTADSVPVVFPTNSLRLGDTDGTHSLWIVNGSNQAANRTLTISTTADSTVTFPVTGTLLATTDGNLTLSGEITATNIHGTGPNNLFIGVSAGNFSVTFDGNTAVGDQTMPSLGAGRFLTAIGFQSLRDTIGGYANSAGGYLSQGLGRVNRYTTSWGVEALYQLGSDGTARWYNTALGYLAGRDTQSDSGLFLGTWAGYGVSDDNTPGELYINSLNRTDAAGARTKSIIYGKQTDDVADQELYLNANKVEISGRTVYTTNEFGVGTEVYVGPSGTGGMNLNVPTTEGVQILFNNTDSYLFTETALTISGSKQLILGGNATISGQLNLNEGATQTNPVSIGNNTDVSTYGVLSFNSNFGNASTLGVFGGGGVDTNLYLSAPTLGSIRTLVNGTVTSTQSATGLTVAGTITAGSGTTVLTNSAGKILQEALVGVSAMRTGTATLVAGSVVVNDGSTAATTRIRLSMVTPGGTVGAAYVSAKVNSTSFTISSTSALDTSTIYYEAFEP